MEERQGPLSVDEERELARRWRDQGDTGALQRLVQAHLGLVIRIAMEFRHSGVRMEDLIQEGNLGLVIGARRFDPDRGTRLATYATYWVRANMLEHVVRNHGPARIGTTRAQRKIFFGLGRAREKVLREKGREGDTAEIAAALGVEEEMLADMLPRVRGRDLSLDDAKRDGDRRTLHDSLADAEALGPEEAVVEAVDGAREKDLLKGALRVLDPRERIIIERRRLGKRSDTLAKLGKRFGISRERVRQLELRALDKLRRAVEVTEVLRLSDETSSGRAAVEWVVQPGKPRGQEMPKETGRMEPRAGSSVGAAAALPLVVLTASFLGVSPETLNRLFPLLWEVKGEVFRTNAEDRYRALGFPSASAFMQALSRLSRLGILNDEGRGKWRWNLDKIPPEWREALEKEAREVEEGDDEDGGANGDGRIVASGVHVGFEDLVARTARATPAPPEDTTGDGDGKGDEETGPEGDDNVDRPAPEEPPAPEPEDAHVVSVPEPVRVPEEAPAPVMVEAPPPPVAPAAPDPLAELAARVGRLEERVELASWGVDALIETLASACFREYFQHLPPELKRRLLQALAERVGR